MTQGAGLGLQGHHDVLAAIPAAYRQAVLDQGERRTFRRGQSMWHQGEPADHVAFLVAGKAMSSYQSRQGRSGTTGFWSAGALLGAADLGTASTRQMTLRCLDDCVAHTVSFDRFDALVLRFPELGLAVVRALSIRLRWVAELALALETGGGQQRLCTALLALGERFGTRVSGGGTLIDLLLTHEDLAAIAGVSRQFVNGLLQDLKRRGALGVDRRRLVLIDSAILARHAGSGEHDLNEG